MPLPFLQKFFTSRVTADDITAAIADVMTPSLVTKTDQGLWQIHGELPEAASSPSSFEEAIFVRLNAINLHKKNAQIVLTRHKKTPAKKPSKIHINGVRKIIAVASGKGGVGKSTVAVGLACALENSGLRVGILDADIYGPSVPKLMGLEAQKPTQQNGKIIPLRAHKVDVMSIGFMVDPAQALIWRGPMVQSAFKQLLADVDWGHDGDLDVLILDTPPGTGDVQLTMAQSISVDGAIIVTTPQELALLDARKGVAMFQTLNVAILGLIENMAGPVFGQGGGEAAALTMGIPFLGRVPLDPAIRVGGDNGAPHLDFFTDMAMVMRREVINDTAD